MAYRHRQGKSPREKFPGVLILLCLFCLPTSLIQGETPPRPRVDPFYTDLLKDGVRAYERQEFSEAARVLRLACFGLLDEPPMLAEGLAQLARAQEATGDQGGAQESIDRLVKLERRFEAFSEADVSADLQGSLAALLPRFTTDEALAEVPSLRQLLSPPPTPEPPQEGVATPVSEPLPDSARERLAEAREMLDQARKAKDLDQPLKLAREVADAYPDFREAQHLTGEIAYRASRWQEAARYFGRGGDPGDEKPTLLFFMAVSLYESGDREQAALLLERSLPGLKQTAYVDRYVLKILGEAGRS